MPVRVYEIAKKVGLDNRAVLAKAKELGISQAKVPSRSLDSITAEYLEFQLGRAHEEDAVDGPNLVSLEPEPTSDGSIEIGRFPFLQDPIDGTLGQPVVRSQVPDPQNNSVQISEEEGRDGTRSRAELVTDYLEIEGGIELTLYSFDRANLHFSRLGSHLVCPKTHRDSARSKDYEWTRMLALMDEESRSLEFKLSALWDHGAGSKSKHLGEKIVKTIAAFLNTDGGTLIIGVSDTREIVGIEADLATLKQQSKDRYQRSLGDIIYNRIGREFSSCLRIEVLSVEQVCVCVIDVRKGRRAAWVDGNDFYIRDGNGSCKISGKEGAAWESLHFKATAEPPRWQ